MVWGSLKESFTCKTCGKSIRTILKETKTNVIGRITAEKDYYTKENEPCFICNNCYKEEDKEFTAKELKIARDIVNLNYECEDNELSARLLVNFVKEHYNDEFKEMMKK